MKTYLVTGAAGFIGFHTSQRLLKQGARVIGLDNLNTYYEVKLKEDRLRQLTEHSNFSFVSADLSDRDAVTSVFADQQLDFIIHLAAPAGVRYSLENPHAYIDSNLVGFTNILEGCRNHKVKHHCQKM